MFLPISKVSRRTNARKGKLHKAKLRAKNRRRRASIKA